MNDLMDNSEYFDSGLDRVRRGIDRGIDRRSSRARWTISVSAFATAGVLAGALTAGALVAPAAGASQLEAAMANVASTYTYDGPLLGEPIFVQGGGRRDVTMPAKPKGANAIIVSIQCLSAGPATVLAKGDQLVASQCENGAADTSDVYEFIPGEKLATTFAIDGLGSYAFWASWYAYPPAAPQSAAQKAAVADGVITRQEYVAGWQRLAACVAQAGFDMVPPSTDVVEYPVGVSSETQAVYDHDCWPREYKRVDEIWQQETATRATSCLIANGFSPAPPASGTGWEIQVREHHLTPEQCGMLK